MSLNRDDISDRLAAVGYIADRDLATALWLMDFLKRPLLLEGEAGVGKTEVAKALAAVYRAELIRLQCYEGLDQNAALYEWNYQRQLLAIKTREGVGANADAIEEHIFSERYLLERPLLAAIRRDKSPYSLSMKLTAPTKSSRLSCSSCCLISRSASRSSELSRQLRSRAWY